MDDITRVCRKCGQEKPLEEFVKDKTRELGYSYTCKHCRREHACKYRADNHERYWNAPASGELIIPKGAGV